MPHHHTINVFVLSVLAVAISTCGKVPEQEDNDQKRSIASLSREAEKLNDIASFISGLPVGKNSSLYKLTQTAEWREYSNEANIAWARFDSIAEKYKAFSKSEIKAPYDTIKTLFYPFSGPDVLFAKMMFPNSEKMVLIGLEEPGSVPCFDSTTKDSLRKILEMYKVAIEDVIQSSFFRTIDMKNELGNTSIDGTAPVIMLFLARGGKEILEVNPMHIDTNGVLIPDGETKEKKHATAIEIQYRDKGESKIKKVYYLSANIANFALVQNVALTKYLKNLDSNIVTFVKSASYLMHKSLFSIIRNFCLDKSALILQDDSGISYMFFKKDVWNIQLYGSYTGPITLFEKSFEQDYLEAFALTKVKPLNFRIGYSQKSNLLMAIKK